MPTVLTQTLIAKALKTAAETGNRITLTDAHARGLELRVGPQGGRWCFRFKNGSKYKRIGIGPYPLWSIAEARVVAHDAAARILARLGLPTEEWMANVRAKADKGGEFVESLFPVGPNGRATWTFAQARDAYLEEIAETRRPHTLRDYKDRLNCPGLAQMQDEPVSRIEPDDIRPVLRKIARDVSDDRAEKITTIIRMLFRWLGADEQIKQSGVTRGVMDGLKPPPRRRTAENAPRVDAYVPPIAELGRALAIARAGVFDDDVSAGIQLVLFTCQRRRPVTIALIADFVESSHGCWIWRMRPAHRKTADRRRAKDDHVVAFGPAAQTVLLDQLARAKAWRYKTGEKNPDGTDEELTSEHLFPGSRPRREGERPVHKDESFITHNFSYMPLWGATPHLIRRSFSTFGRKLLSISRDDVKVVLDHNEGAAGNDVNRSFYDYDEQVPEKLEIMTAWETLLEKACAQALVDDPKLSDKDWLAAEIAKRRAAAKVPAAQKLTAVKTD